MSVIRFRPSITAALDMERNSGLSVYGGTLAKQNAVGG